jgi:hypothetical protein
MTAADAPLTAEELAAFDASLTWELNRDASNIRELGPRLLREVQRLREADRVRSRYESMSDGAPFATCATCGKEPGVGCRTHFAARIRELEAEVQRLREERDSAIDRGLGYRHERGVAEYTIDNMQRERAALLARAEAAEARVAELERERDEAFSELEAIAHEDGDCECLVFDGEVDLCPHAKRMAEVKP